jgi:hypothetical protein
LRRGAGPCEEGRLVSSQNRRGVGEASGDTSRPMEG